MISNAQAIARLQKRDEWLVSRIQKCEAEGTSFQWFDLDRQSIALAIAALEFVIATLEYEQSQSSPSDSSG